ncbi:MAG: redoxin domain-containing protein [Polyangiaceae bacterium]|jgi:peroxiredoxin
MRVVVLLAIASGVGCGGARTGPVVPVWERPGLYGAARPEMGPPQPGDPARDFELPTAGGSFRLGSLRGSWVVLHFTASWCPYCDAEVEHLGSLAEAYASRNVKVVLIGVEEDAAHWSEYTKARVPGSVLALSDDRGDVAKKYAPPRAQPSFADRAQVMLDSTLVVDPGGTIRLFLFPDSKHFDPTFAAVRGELDQLTASWLEQPRPMTPEAVVSIEVRTPPRVQPGDRGEVLVALKIAAGYHVMSDRPSEPSYIATRIRFDDVEDLAWHEPRYPEATSFRVSDKSIATFQGNASVSVPFEVAAGAGAGDRTVAGMVRYQACTVASCLFPVTRRIEATLAVGGAGR